MQIKGSVGGDGLKHLHKSFTRWEIKRVEFFIKNTNFIVFDRKY